jgi:hypothetical protein
MDGTKDKRGKVERPEGRDEPTPGEPGGGQILIYRDGSLSLQVRLDGQTVWLTQKQLAELYQTTVPNINQHLKAVYEEGELAAESTIKQYLIVQTEGSRNVRRQVCEVAGAINGVDPFARELLILHHIERLEVATLADAHGTSVDDIRKALAEGQFIELLCGLSSGDDEAEPDVQSLPVELADCIDLPWAENLGVFALRYAADWSG